MARLLTVVLATALVGASFASAQAQDSYYRYQDGRAWRHYPPNYGAEPGLEALGVLFGPFLTEPCYNGGCVFDPRDLAYGASWGRVDPDPGATGRAFRALSAISAKAAVSPVMIEPGTRQSPSHKRHRTHKPTP